MTPLTRITVAGAAVLACLSTGIANAADGQTVEAKPAIQTTTPGMETTVEPVAVRRYTWYPTGYTYVAPSYYLTPPTWSGYYHYGYPSYGYYRGTGWTTSYRPYYDSNWPYSYSYGWVPTTSHYGYYGPPFGSGFYLRY